MRAARICIALLAISGCGARTSMLGFDDAVDSGPADASAPDAGIAGSLSALRWEIPCDRSVSGLDPSICATRPPVPQTATMSGDANRVYIVRLRFRGVVETKRYVGGESTGRFYIGGGPADAWDPWNAYSLTVSDPPETYFLNSGPSSRHYCVAINYEREIAIRGQAQVVLASEIYDAKQIVNQDRNMVPIVISDIPPAPAPFDGQFIQMDVVSVR